ncbi:MAG: triose-phosphate isomerase [Candidatus Chaera renei]|uniref:Triosephosphate isomerase n=1 Tax=Candidatus Chaera renei TaxID=2506947 RepID=A0A4Q0AJV7_9BACT|nr:MAG: triose-phosphate isomerase [Candidatus Chaera renei]
MRKKLIVGNWKMHFDTHRASLYLHELTRTVKAHRDVEVVLCPNFLALQSLSLQVDHSKFKLGAQNCYWRDEGAYTGEVSATMLRGVVTHVIVGHSERRHVFGETDREVRHKTQAVLRNGLTPIVCIGETASERSANETHDVIQGQLTAALANVTSEEISRVVVSYEPVWAISSGTDYQNHPVASPAEVGRLARQIRSIVKSLYGKAAADSLRVLYGGSSNTDNAAGYLEVKGIDGLLVGGASLNAVEFVRIVETAARQAGKQQETVDG